MVGAERFELPTLCSQSRCATRLRYAPTLQSYRTEPADLGCRVPFAHRSEIRPARQSAISPTSLQARQGMHQMH